MYLLFCQAQLILPTTAAIQQQQQLNWDWDICTESELMQMHKHCKYQMAITGNNEQQ